MTDPSTTSSDRTCAPTRVAIIGCGAVTQQIYAPYLLQVPHLKVSMVSDLRNDSAREAAAAFGCPTGSAEEAIAIASLVVVATPPEAHYSLAVQALSAGRHVCVEKPFTTSKQEAESLVQLACRQQRRLFVAQFRRHYPKLALARDLVATGVLGNIRSIDMHEGARFDWIVTTDYIHRHRYGGVLFDTGAHTLDMALYAACLDEMPTEVSVSSIRRDKPEPSHEVDARFTLHTERGNVTCRLLLSRLQSVANVVRIHGERGMLEFDVTYQGNVYLTSGGRRVAIAPTHQLDSSLHAFVMQYHRLTTDPSGSPLAARFFINQIAVLEALANG
jgi:predicted dehydrogenase